MRNEFGQVKEKSVKQTRKLVSCIGGMAKEEDISKSGYAEHVLQPYLQRTISGSFISIKVFKKYLIKKQRHVSN